jgi:hypothetical protein
VVSADPRRARAHASILFVLSLLGASSGAVADDAAILATAEREFQAGYRALQAGDCETALVHYQRSYDLAPRPRTMFNLAVCQEELGQGGLAWRSYHAFLRIAEARDAAIVARARERVTALQAKLRGQAFIDSSPSGAAVYLDDEPQPRGTTPLALSATPGLHRLRIAPDDAPAVVRTLEIVPDGIATLSLELATPASVTVEVEPAAATIRPADGAAPVTGRFHASVSTGRHRFSVTHPGYAAREVVIDAQPGREHTERVVLRPLTAPARVHVVTDRDAVVTLDRTVMTLRMRDVASGVHQLAVERVGHHGYRGEVAVARGEDVTITVELPRRRPRALTLGLTGAGAAALATGGVLGVLALRDVTSPDQGDHDRGKRRALVADGLFVTGVVALIVAKRMASRRAPRITIERRAETP